LGRIEGDVSTLLNSSAQGNAVRFQALYQAVAMRLSGDNNSRPFPLQGFSNEGNQGTEQEVIIRIELHVVVARTYTAKRRWRKPWRI
jgi:hypothetical protein